MTFERVVVAVRAKGEPEIAALAARAARRGFRRIALPVGSTVALPFEVERWTYSEETLTTPERTVAIETIREPEGLVLAQRRAATSGGPLAVRWVGERVLPLENLLAERRGGFQVWVVLQRIEEAGAALGSLEKGADRVIVEVASEADLDRVEAQTESSASLEGPLQPVKVVRVEAGGIGDRVIVDTTSLLTGEEGLLVGSSASFLFLVVSEAVGSRYTRPRPFRVNAGAAHSYTLLADGTTRYLSELEAGDAVLIVAADGRTRRARVGRLKIERRPLLMVQAEVDGLRPTVFLQEAETVRLRTIEESVATTALVPGACVLGLRLPPARHLGTVVDEAIVER
ncbi:MAG: 3-dehydroquinate synthase [Thermoplasmata archaeon]|nr:3-dehydroquinate synthase [Thermoplasmata archaeon]